MSQQIKIESILRKLINYRSYMPYEKEAFSYLKPFLREKGFNVTEQKLDRNRSNLLAKRGNQKKSILIYMHLDTVHPDTNWQSSPMVLNKRGDKYIGLGVFDMKGGIAALLSILDSIELKKYSLKLAFGIDEEGISEGVYTLVNSDFIKDVEIAYCPEACIVPPDWNLPLMLVIGGRGRCVLDVKIPGKLVHGAEEVGGINAIDQSAIFIKSLKNWKTTSDKNMGRSSFFVRSIHAESEGLSLPDVVNLEIDYQMVGNETPEKAKASLTRFINNLYKKNILDKNLASKYYVAFKERKTPYTASYAVSPKNKYVQTVKQLSKKSFGKVRFEYTKSIADQNVLVNAGIPTITIGPIGGNAHQANEWVSAKSLKNVANFYKELFSGF